MLKILSIILSLCILSIPGAWAQSNKAQTERIVHDYIVSHPEVLIEASHALHQKGVSQVMAQDIPGLFFASQTPVGDNPKGDVSIIEFFDYQCPYCKDATPVFLNAMTLDKNIRMVFKEFPIFGENSELAAKAALAANRQNQYVAMHKALMEIRQPINEELIIKTAQSLKLNIDQLKRDMSDPQITNEIQSSRKLAEQLGVRGTPVFLIAATPKWTNQGWQLKNNSISFIMGKINESTLKGAIKKAREAKA
jgi:protein-disulfide isomerase